LRKLKQPMLVAEYNRFVAQTDQYAHRAQRERHEIAIYGVAGEIGSLLSAVKKRLLAEDGDRNWNRPNDEIIVELGDVIWYCFSLAQILNKGGQFNILTSDIAKLRRTISGQSRRAAHIRQALDVIDRNKRNQFLAQSRHFPRTESMTFDHYQTLAFMTARTEGKVLLEVCLAVLWQLGAELLRKTLPAVELKLNKNVADRDANEVLGEIAWHLAAIASLYKLSLNNVVGANVEKVRFRSNRSDPTPFHDESAHTTEQLPRRFEISFVSVGPGLSRMYMDGKQLGDPLTDNSYDDDGYRFHDVMHLSNVAHLGWSPVIRKLMNRKRKRSGDKIDEVEDGARALLVEEVVLKAIHSEGKRLAKDGSALKPGKPERQFPTRATITFRLLKSLQDHVEGLEVHRNKFWEWEDAIYEGARVFFELRKESQGTVTVDMLKRTLAFSPDVCIDLKGKVAGVGTATKKSGMSREVLAKHAILMSLGFDTPSPSEADQLDVKLLGGKRVSVKAQKKVREKIWALGVLDFQLSFFEPKGQLCCTAIAIAD
jgi:NTP pyrophosphatase (non-canonical NTP hydrolase)